MCAHKKQLSPVDAAWLHMEHPTNLMMITGVMFLEGQVGFEDACRVYAERLLPFRRFRQRVVEASFGLGRPYWEDDPQFNIDAHMHHIALPEPGDRQQLAGLLSDLASTPLDFTKPLWQVHVVDNVEGGSAVVWRIHHCIGDGTALIAVFLNLLDTDPERQTPLLPPRKSRPRRGALESLARGAYGLLKGAQSLVGSALHEGMESLLHPSRLVELSEEAARAALRGASVAGHALVLSNDRPTALKGPLGVSKRVAWSDPVSVEQTKAIAHAMGAKVNDVLVSAMAGALRRYLIDRGEEVTDAEIRAVIPVDMRPIEKALDLGNVFGLVFLAMPIGLADPGVRLREVKRRMDALKQSGEAILYYALLNVFGMTPRQLEETAVDFFAARATTVFTNVAGPRMQLYFAGHAVRHGVFFVPQSGRLGMGISIYSYNGQIVMGVIVDAGLVPDPERITDYFLEEFQRLAPVAEEAAAAETGSQERPRCAAYTRTGSRCRNLAAPGLSYCQRHAAQ